jgi:hypothetical protein
VFFLHRGGAGSWFADERQSLEYALREATDRKLKIRMQQPTKTPELETPTPIPYNYKIRK